MSVLDRNSTEMQHSGAYADWCLLYQALSPKSLAHSRWPIWRPTLLSSETQSAICSMADGGFSFMTTSE